jgi:hypothetical protein
MLRNSLGILFGGVFAVLALAPISAGASENDCTVAKDATTEIGKACAEGGVKRAKAVMKAMVKQAKKQEMKLDCDSCHKNEEKWDLTSDAKDQYKKLLTLLGKEK